MIVDELKGPKSLKAFAAFNRLMLGLKMLPANFDRTYEEFLQEIQDSDIERQKQLIRQAVSFVSLEKDEILDIVCFCRDKNGVPYSQANVGNLPLSEIVDAVVSVGLKIAEIRIYMVTEDEKKN